MGFTYIDIHGHVCHTDNCNHDWSGDDVMYSASGRRITWHTYKQWASYHSKWRNELIMEHHEIIGDPIVCSTPTCKHCKVDFNPQKHYIYA